MLFLDNLAVTPRKEVIEKDSPEKILISAGQKYPTQYEDPEDSNFFTYFMFISVLFIGVYIAYHNKQKVIFTSIPCNLISCHY